MPTRLLAKALIAFIFVSCANLPPEYKVDNYNDAAGAVTVSTPLVVPWAPLTDTTRRLNYGKQLDEGELLKAIHGRQARAFRLQHSALQIMASLSQQLKVREADEGEESTAENETDSTGERKRLALADEGINQRLVELLSPVMKGDYSLAPDDAATLIAAYKTYMVNLEEYYNLSTVGSTTWGGGLYRPYKVHMTVSAEPGWYARYRNHDAVAHITFPPGIRVVSVSPPETAQALEQLDASLDQFLSSLDVAGAISGIAGSLGADYLEQTARRVEGLRANRTMIVGFPSENAVRIRFRPIVAAVERGLDLQPLSRLVTAVILVPSKISEQQVELWRAGELRESKKMGHSGERVTWIDPGEAERLNHLQIANAEQGAEKIAGSLDAWQASKDALGLNAKSSQASLPVPSHIDLKMRVESYFAAGLIDDAGDRSAPKDWVIYESSGRDRIQAQGPYSKQLLGLNIPAWLGDIEKPLAIVPSNTSGTYNVDVAALAPHRKTVLSAEKDVKEASATLAKAEAALQQSTKGADLYRHWLNQAHEISLQVKKLKELPEGERHSSYSEQLAKLNAELKVAEERKASYSKDLEKEGADRTARDRAREAHARTKEALERAEQFLLQETGRILKNATLTVSLSITAPPAKASLVSNTYVVTNLDLYVRLAEVDQPWIRFNASDQTRVLTWNEVCLTMAPPTAIEDPKAWPQARFHLEAVLIERKGHAVGPACLKVGCVEGFDSEMKIVSRVALPIVVDPPIRAFATSKP